jgi:hypothetical protein
MSAPIPRLRFLLALTPIVLAIFPMLAVADGPKGAEWASKDAVIYLESSNPQVLLDRTLDPKFQAYLVSIPPYARFIKSDAFTQQKAGVNFVATLLDTTWEKGVRALAGGGVVLAVEVEKGKPPWGYLAVTPSDAAFLDKAHTKLLELARADAQGKSKPDPVKESEYKGVKIYSVGAGETHAIIEGALVLTQTDVALKAVIDRSKGGKFESIAGNKDWAAKRATVKPETVAWSFARLDRLREIDAKRFTIPEMVDGGATFLFAPWIEAVRKAPWVAASINWGEARMIADIQVPNPPKGYSNALKTYLPTAGKSAPAPLKPKGVIASMSLWRDLSAIWEVRNELFTPQFVQGLAQLDTVAGQYFGGRDFGTGVLGAISSHWRLVVATQDFSKLDPIPDLKLPAFALVIDLKPDDDEFAQRLKVAFQSFVGLANIGAAQTKAPPLELLSEQVDGVTIASTRFMVSKGVDYKKGGVHQRHNFSPSAAQIDNHFVISSSVGLVRDLIPAVRAKETPSNSTVILQADGGAVAKLLELNRQRLITQNMMEKGNDKASASSEIDVLLGLLRYVGQGELSAKDGEKSLNFKLDLTLGAK